MVDHLDDRRHAAAGLADHLGQGAAELDLARGVGAVAELVLEALQLEALVARAVGQHARQREAGDAFVGLREDEEEVAHRGAAEPLVAGDLPPAVVAGQRARGVGAHVRAALLLGHRHAAQGAGLLGGGPQLGVVGRRGQPRHPLGGDVGLRAQRRDRGEGHRDRAAEARLGLARADVGGGARDVGARLVGAPRQRVQLLLDAGAHERVPGGVELDLVAAVAEAVVGVQHRRVLVGLDAPAHRLAAPERAGGAQALARPAAALALEALPQRRVVLEEVAALQRRDLVEDLVGRVRRGEHQTVSSVTERRQKATRSATSASASTSSATGESGPTSASPSAPTSAAAVSSTFWGASSPAATPSRRTSSKPAA